MTISEVSDQDLSRWIAEKFEPKPKDMPCHLYKCAELPSEWTAANGVIFTPLKFWCYGGSADNAWHLNRDMVNDANMTLMLLENLKCSLIWSEWPHSISSGKDGIFGWITSRGALYSASNTKLGRSVAEAFALANGWTQ